MSRVLVLGGLDPSGGAGLLRDGWTLAQTAPELELDFVATALTVQGHGHPATVEPSSAEVLARRFARLLADHRYAAVKLGLVADEHAPVLADALARLREGGARIVLDPVLCASDGGRIGASPATLLALAERVDLMLPNPAEWAALGLQRLLPHISNFRPG